MARRWRKQGTGSEQRLEGSPPAGRQAGFEGGRSAENQIGTSSVSVASSSAASRGCVMIHS